MFWLFLNLILNVFQEAPVLLDYGQTKPCGAARRERWCFQRPKEHVQSQGDESRHQPKTAGGPALKVNPKQMEDLLSR